MLDLHLKAVAYDNSFVYKNNAKTYRGHIQARKNEIEQKPLVNLHREAIDVFRKSDWLATSCQPEAVPVCVGTQTLENLEIIAGQQGSESACRLFSFIPPESASCFGKVSAALLLAQPTTNKTILLQRQDALRYLIDPANSTAYQDLVKQFTLLMAEERYLLPILQEKKSYDNSFFSSGSLLLALPGLNKLKQFPSVRTADKLWGLIEEGSWTVFMGVAAWRLAAYGFHALRLQKTGKQIDGAWGVPKNTGRNFEENKNDLYMPFEIKQLCKLLYKSPTAQGVLSLSSAAFLVAILVKYHINYLRGKLEQQKFDWYCVARAVAGLEAIRRIYKLIEHNEMFRLLPDCAPLYDFFEVKVPKDSLLKELVSLLHAFPLDLEYGSHWFLGYTSRIKELFEKKSVELADLAVGVGRVEAYVCFARLLTKTDKNNYCFPEYATSDQPAVFTVKGLWNTALNRSFAVPSDVFLGWLDSIRIYLLTGPNAAGKSTFLKGAGQAALLGQTIGLVPGEQCQMSLFSVIETYLNITDDISQGNSLFKKEVMRAAELMHRVQDVNQKPVLLIFDEMFSGTTPHEGISCASSVLMAIAEKVNVLSCIATHYVYLTKVAKQYRSIATKCVRLVYDEEKGKYIRQYSLQDGVSDQHVALDMLTEEGVDSSIVVQAREVLKDIEKNGVGA